MCISIRMKEMLLKPNFLLKCIALHFCFLNVMLLCSIPYWSVHKMEESTLIYVQTPKSHQSSALPELPPIDMHNQTVLEIGIPLDHQYHLIGVASATYLLIQSVLIILYLYGRPPKLQMLIMIFFGAMLNIVAAIQELIKYSEYSKHYSDIYGEYGYEDPDVLKPMALLALGIMLLFAGLTMSIDFVLYFVLKQDEPVNEE